MTVSMRLAALVTPLTLIAAALVGPAQAQSFEQQSVCVTESHRDAILSFTVPGRIKTIHYNEGDTVEAGTALIDLDQTVEALEVKRRYLIWKDESDLKAARLQNETFKVMLDSTRSLFEATKSVSRDELFKMELEYNASEAEYQRLTIAEQREQLEHELALATLAKRTLSAPFDGTIVDVMLEEGEVCEANQPMVQLVDTSRARLLCNIEENVARRLETGDVLPVEIPLTDVPFKGSARVEFIAPVVDPASGLLRVNLTFDNPDGKVRPGVPAYVSLQAGAPLAATGNE